MTVHAQNQDRGVYNVAKMINAVSKLPIDQRAIAVPAILKHILELPHEELALCLTLLGTTISNKPNVTIQTAREWAKGTQEARTKREAKQL